MRTVLASRSPQRKALLDALGLDFEIQVTGTDEAREGDPAVVVAANARAKAEAGWAGAGTLVIAGDTEVAIDGGALGTPADEGEARALLGLLSGREHTVVGAVCLLGPEIDPASTDGGSPVRREGVEATTVRFRALEPALIDAYLASGEWRGRAGGYAIQGLGSALVSEVTGDISNVIGLPMPLLLDLAPELAAGRG